MSDPPESRHRIKVRVLVILASILAFLSIFTTWVDRQALDTGEWVNTSGRLLEDKEVSDAVANYAIDQLYASVDVQKELRAKLPNDLKPLSGAASAGLRELAVKAAESALQRPRFQNAWREANKAAHQQLVAILDNNNNNAVSTANGEVVLDLRLLVEQLAERIGIDKQVSKKIPPDVAQLEIVRSDELKTAQKVSQAVKGLALLFSLGTLLLFGLAAYLAKGRRWVVVLGYGVGLIVAGIAALALRRVGGGVVGDQRLNTGTAKPAATNAFSIGTDLLASIAQTAIVIGVLFVAASFLASPADGAVRTRRALAPSFIERPVLVWSAFAGLVMIYLILNPPHGNRELFSTLALIAMAGFGLEALSRKVHREFPDAKPGDLRERMRERVRELGGEGARRMRSAMSDLGDLVEGDRDEEDARLERLAKLGDLKEKGVLTAAEFKAEKQRLLQGNEAAGKPARTGKSKAAAKRRPTTTTKK